MGQQDKVKRILLGSFLWGLASCAAASGATVGAAALTSAVAVGVGAANVSNGQCFSPCVPGTYCNAKTATCDPLPCRGECGATERCDESGVVPRCVATGEELQISTTGNAPPKAKSGATPAATQAADAPTNASSGAP